MPDSSHITSPEPNRSPYAHTSDKDLLAAYKRVSDRPDAPELGAILAEVQHRRLVVP